MPLAGSLDIRPFLDDAPVVDLDDRELHVDEVSILHVLYELKTDDIEALVPPALNPTIPPVIAFLAYQAESSEYGPFSLVQIRLTARAGVRPRGYLVNSVCDNEDLAARLSGAWGFRTMPGHVRLRRYHDRVECGVTVDRRSILDVALVDPEPVTGHDIQYHPSMHLAHVRDGDGTRPRIIQVDTEYVFRQADRGRPLLSLFDAAAWTSQTLTPIEPISASLATCEMTIPAVRYLCNPDLPASEGTEKVAAG
jgi:hypothetical protein